MPDNEQPSDAVQKRALRISYVLGLGIALIAGGAFFAYTTLRPGYNDLTRFGGSLWVMLLAVIIALPTLAPAIRTRLRR